MSRRVVLLGAGHAQLSVLGALARQRLPAAEVTLVTLFDHMLYSGMVPGLVARRFTEADCTIDIAALARAAGVQLRLGRAVALDAAAQSVTLADGERIGYDVLSLNTGPTQDRDRIPGAREHALFVRPLAPFIALWQRTRVLARQRPLAVVVVGNGAAGFELALAVRQDLGPRASVTLIGEGPLLPSYPDNVRARATRALKRANVQVLPGRCTAVEARHVEIGAMRVACDVPILATGSDPPGWLATSGLALDAAGLVRVDATLRSVSHPQVFAVGDVSVNDDMPYARNGVYAVRVGPALALNLRRAAGGGELKPYKPQARALNLLALGDGRAIASWGEWAAQGRLMGWWKDRIDRAFIARWRTGD
jgi:selenide,water dikinase